jgi:hypothetical protein
MSELKDPLNTRVVKSVPIPYQQSLTDEQLFPGEAVLNWSLLREFLRREGKLSKAILMQLIMRGLKMFRSCCGM